MEIREQNGRGTENLPTTFYFVYDTKVSVVFWQWKEWARAGMRKEEIIWQRELEIGNQSENRKG